MLKFLFSVIFSLYLLQVSSQKMDLKFEGLTIQDGLSSNTVNDVMRDIDGFIWVATDDGISRYDGQKFKNYRASEKDSATLCTNIISTLLVNSQNRLIVGTSNGLNIYNPILDRFERLMEGVDVRDIIEYSKGGYLLASDEGLIKLDSDYNEVKMYLHDVDDSHSLVTNSLSCLLEDTKGRLWIGSYQFGISLMVSEGIFENYSLVNDKSVSDICYEITEDYNHRILAATYDNGVIYFNEMFAQFIELPVVQGKVSFKKAIAIYEDEDKNLWIGTDGAGLVLYDSVSRQYISYTHSIVSSRSISDNVVNVIYSDGRGGMWLGSHHRGLNFISTYTTNFKHKEYIPSFENNNIVSAFKKDKKNNLWLATDGGGLLYFDLKNRRTGMFEHNKEDSKSLSSNNALTLEIDSNENVWIGFYNGGLDIYDVIKDEFIHYINSPTDSSSLAHNVVWSISKDLENRMWVCTKAGLCLYRPKTNDFIRFTTQNTNLKSDDVRSVLEIDSTHFYVATAQGLALFDLTKRSFKTFIHSSTDSTSISSSFVLNITRDYGDKIWIGTYGGGLNLFDPITETFRYWKKEDGLSNNYICGIVPGLQGDLWLTTQHGLSRFNPRRNTFQNFHYNDGLQDDKFSIGAVLQWDAEKILIGGINGYNSFRPQYIATNSFAPTLHFTDFKIFNKSVDFNKKREVLDRHVSHVDQLDLNYKQNMLTFHFAALNFIQNEKNQVSFYLEGVDLGWSEPENIDRANYTNLSPGEYVFHVKAANNHGVWSDKQLSLKIIIHPPFWKTWWFRILVFILVVLSLYSAYMIRVNNIIQQKKQLELEVANRTEIIYTKNLELEDKEMRRVQSLNYAKLIQNAFLPLTKEISEEVKELFILFQPSEIVSGDFYWMKKIDKKVIICAVDCTGHGVPGAFMSMMGTVLLDRIIEVDKITSPSEILERLHKGVVRSLHQKQTHNADGMDAAIIVLDKEENTLSYAGAMNPLLYFQNEKMTYIKGTRRGLGGVDQFKEKPFEEHVIDIFIPTTFYIYSDGYQDQFGANGKKYMNKRFKELLVQLHQKPLDRQRELLAEEHLSWRNNEAEQTDDILVIGCRV
jgi:ligand-binding sensor domain-containing protein/serine phosphatase RsbU (regulator of sigma subunit)